MTLPDHRISDWESELASVIDAASVQPFTWGKHDCCSFAARTVEAITGTDPMKGLHTYRSAQGAARTLKKRGWSGVYRALYGILGKSIPAAQARRGDVVFARLDGATFGVGSGAGICLGVRSAFPGETGLVYLPTLNATRAWPIGRPHPKGSGK